MVYYLPFLLAVSVKLEHETPQALYLKKKVSVYIPNQQPVVNHGFKSPKPELVYHCMLWLHDLHCISDTGLSIIVHTFSVKMLPAEQVHHAYLSA